LFRVFVLVFDPIFCIFPLGLENIAILFRRMRWPGGGFAAFIDRDLSGGKPVENSQLQKTGLSTMQQSSKFSLPPKNLRDCGYILKNYGCSQLGTITEKVKNIWQASNSLVPGGNCDIWRANSSEPVHERVALLPHVLAPCRGLCSLASAQACAQLDRRHFLYISSCTVLRFSNEKSSLHAKWFCLCA
jgi:hypothetical protein